MLFPLYTDTLLPTVQAEGDARSATKLAPTWPKPLHRLVQALQVMRLGLQHSCSILLDES